jgi:hypothetical protein
MGLPEEQLWDPWCERPSGLVAPSRIDAEGVTGPTRGQAAGPHWERVAPRWYAPAERPTCVEQRILEQACRLVERDRGAVTGWASLRWQGAAFFDGLGPGGKDDLDVPLLVGTGNVRPAPGSHVSKEQLAPTERLVVDGLPVTTIQRALFDEVRRRGELWQGVQAIDMAAAAGLISVDLFGAYVTHRPAWEGVPLVRKALDLASNDSRSPRETWLRLVWILVAELPPPLCNRSLYDLNGRLLGIPDLFDPTAGLVGEYHGGHHKSRHRHQKDVSREELFRNHGLEYFEVVEGDSRAVVAGRMISARSRAKFLDPERRAWTLEPPPWVTPAESLDERFARLGLVEALTHR